MAARERPVHPWNGTRPGVAAARSPADAQHTLVVFDVPCDKARRRLGELCKDYGLTRFQWSAFQGEMTRTRREELFDRASQLLGEAEGGGKLLVLPVAGREVANALKFPATVATAEREAV